MTSSFTRRRKRATAWVLLTAWLFALAAGVANACLIEVRGTHGHPQALDRTVGEPSTVGAGHRLAADDEANHAPRSGAEASCLKVCDEVPQSPAQPAGNVDAEDPPLLAALWSLLPPLDGNAVQSATPDFALPPAPPLRVRFSRLAL
jgi:hypothetical protein